jgi:hypothetical protein
MSDAMDMMDRRISVIAPDRTVIVDGEAYALPADFVFPEGLHALQWHPGIGTMPGHISKTGDSHGIEDFTVFGPYLEAWAKAKEASDAAAKAAADDHAARTAAVQKQIDDGNAQRAAQQAEMEARAAYHEALNRPLRNRPRGHQGC